MKVTAFVMAVVVTLLLLGGSQVAAGRRGSIDNVMVWLDFFSGGKIIVEGVASDDSDWVGLTIFTEDGEELDFPAREVEGNWMNRTFHVSWPVEGYEGARFTVALWDEKVRCPRGRLCKYCKKNGYHMEGPLDRERGVVKYAF
ncbi:MAG: hypothetical protein KAW17_11375 [Candidatus Eisenbacteria sp.]|nr:hypothetical protein [Candidatus Eisenbacteria bacterium]